MLTERPENMVASMKRVALAADWLELGHFEPEISTNGTVTSSRVRIAGELGSWVIPLESTIPLLHPDGEMQDCVDAQVILPADEEDATESRLEVYWITNAGIRHAALANFALAFFEPDIDDIR